MEHVRNLIAIFSFLMVFSVIIYVQHNKAKEPKNTVNFTHTKGGLILQHITINGVDCVVFQNKTSAGIDCDF